jgi:hypothetical protein
MDEPWCTRIGALQERMNGLQGDCGEGSLEYEHRLRQIEERIAKEDELARGKLEHVKVDLARLQAGCGEECAKVEERSKALAEELRQVEGELLAEIGRERLNCRENESRLLGQYQDAIQKLRLEQARTYKERSERQGSCQKAIREELERAEEEFQEECEAMEGQH